MELGDQESVGFDDQSRVLLELDALFHLVPAFRLGLGAFFVPSVGVEADGSSLDEDWGRELAPVAVFEGVFGANVAGTLRAFIGANILFPGGDLQDSMDDIEETCSALSVEGYGCVYELGPFLGLTLGAGGGVVGHVSEHIALRGDLMVQYLSSSGPSVDAAGPNSETLRVDTSWSTTRLWALFGLEY